MCGQRLLGRYARDVYKRQALILPDEAFLYYSQGMYDTYVNAVLSEQACLLYTSNTEGHPIKRRNQKQEFVNCVTLHFLQKEHHILSGDRCV